jgi:SAM-dependent methyltransferase
MASLAMSTDKPSSAKPRLLHLGCGLFAPPQWTNVDGSLNAWLAQHPRVKYLARALRLVPGHLLDIPWPVNVRIVDARKPLPWADQTFDGAYSSHFLEHLYRDQAMSLLKECRRVLKPGAPCRMLVPDLRVFVNAYIAESASEASAAGSDGDAAGRLCERLLLRLPCGPKGLVSRIQAVLRDFHPHKWMYDGRSLASMMSSAGFEDCRERAYLDSELPFLEKVENADRILNGGGVAVEGRRPN